MGWRDGSRGDPGPLPGRAIGGDSRTLVGTRVARSLGVPTGSIRGAPPGSAPLPAPIIEDGCIRHDDGSVRHFPSPADHTKHVVRTGSRDVTTLMDEISSYLLTQPAEPSPTTTREGWSPSPLRVLLPYSGSEEADRLLDATRQYAQLMAAVVRVVHVREYDICRGACFYLDSHEEVVRLTLDAVTRLRGRGVEATGIVRNAPRGAVPAAILEEASDSKVSLILLGAHRRRLRDLAFPSVVRRVLRKAACPVLVVRTDLPDDVFPPRSEPADSKHRKPAA